MTTTAIEAKRRTDPDATNTEGAPFVFPYRTENGCYAYDANTSRILKVSPEVYRTLIRVLDGGWPANPKAAAEDDPGLASVLHLRSQGVLLGRGVRPVPVMEHRKCLERLIDKQLSQLTLEITEGCNLRCRYCIYGAGYENQREHGAEHMEMPTIEKALGYFFDHNEESTFTSVGFYGGEPLLAFENIKNASRLVHAHPRGHAVHLHMTTNGTLLTPEKFPFLVDNKFALLVSLDGPESTHDRNRKNVAGRGTFRKIMKNLAALKEYAPDFYERNIMFSCVRAPATKPGDLAGFFTRNRLTRKHGVQLAGISDGCPALVEKLVAEVKDWGELREERSRAMQEFVDRVVNRKTRGAKWNFLQDTHGGAFTSLHRRQLAAGSDAPAWINGMCVPGWRKLFVAANGDLFTCERVGRSLPIGHVDRGIDLDVVFDYLAKHWEFTDRQCTKCWAIRLCGACQSTIGGPDGIDQDRIAEYCGAELEHHANTLIMYTKILEHDPTVFDYIEEISIS